MAVRHEFDMVRKYERVSSGEVLAMKFYPGATYLIVVHRSEELQPIIDAINGIAEDTGIRGSFVQVDDIQNLKVFRISGDPTT